MIKDKFIEGCQNVDITKSPHGELTIKFVLYCNLNAWKKGKKSSS